MNGWEKAFCRVYQAAFRIALPVLPYRSPKVYESVEALEEIMSDLEPSAALLVTDRGVVSAGLSARVEEKLAGCGVKCVRYDGVQPNPTIRNVEEALQMYHEGNCRCILALGGGSAMDCAKGVGARVACPNRTLRQLKGLLKVLRRIPPLIAIPTTAGTGSEVTLAAVLTDGDTKHKYTMNDFTLIPRYAILDPEMTRSLPPHLTATTGMDALTHAVEAYIGRSTTRETRRLALEAVRLIFANVERVYRDGNDMTARRNMLRASYAAGEAFSKSYVGYVHAVAHSLGGQYNIPHGLANAVLMPCVLDAYGAAAHRKLRELAMAAGVAEDHMPEAEAAARFIAAIRELNAAMGIPTGLKGIRREDIPMMARHAAKEANPLYPVPVLWNAQELERLYEAVMEEGEAA
ncbi:MAG: iron-containing alcohol dehydrogenase [Aristaeellaceae bacterium]